MQAKMKESPSHLEFFPGNEGKNMLNFTVGFIAMSGYAFCGSAGMQGDMIL